MLRRAIRAASAALLVLTLTAAGQLAGVVPAAAVVYVPITGAGSTWSSNAIDQWNSNVKQYGITVNYTANGSTAGRNQFASGLLDFGVSEIAYGKDDAGDTEAKPKFKYAYMPIVAGGTAFMYNLEIGGKRVTNLRLSGDTLAKIFTNVITVWNDPAIKTDNPGLSLPARKIVPVVRSDGSGTTAQFTTWMKARYPDIWDAYCKKAGRSTPCKVTSLYPTIAGSAMTAQSGSQNVAGYVAQASSVGAITYVEYSYAKNARFPIAKIRNAKDYYVEPTAQSVAVALLAAKINQNENSADYLTQDLSGVYTYSDTRTYPLSSYSYMLVPTQTTDKFTTNKGKTLGAFAYYFLCEGQKQADDLGYSPLPKNLVQAGYTQVAKIPGVVAKPPDLSGCNNPTFSKDGTNILAKNAPYPKACDKVGTTQCATGTGGATQDTPTTGGGTKTGTGTGTNTGTTGAGTGTGTGATAGNGAAAGAIDPDTGLPAGGGAGGTGVDSALAGSVTVGPQLDSTLKWVLISLAVALLVGLTVGPPLIARGLQRGGKR
ncbi:phosphate ABC transporter substrate-binding protein PstS [Actinoplanes sp. L3-i22]|uniref:phosphate ABC transporter substrate-binding protein PstS n=1 Tax=Actinoplanes sp. L3-i22 TaxID=2836373 RepID=UPI001C8463C2|nr:phosphate ABC transporter substrate-binding protein PstS [Actinoplanes sp. L3-i22]